MILIAENFHTRNKKYMEALKKKDPKAISRLSKELADAGAEVINVQCSLDGSGDAEALPMAVEAVVKATGLTISLDSRNIEALKKAIPCAINRP